MLSLKESVKALARGKVPVIPLGRTDGVEGFGGCLGQDFVVDVFGIAGFPFHGDLGAADESRPPGHVVQPGNDFLHLPVIGGPDHIADRRMVLDHVGGPAAHVQIGVVDSGFHDHVFPEVIGPHPHDLTGIQGAAAQFGSASGVGGDAFELVGPAHIGVQVGGWRCGFPEPDAR